MVVAVSRRLAGQLAVPNAPVTDLVVGGALVAYHVAVHGRGRGTHRLAANVGVAALAVAAARRCGVSRAEMGLSREAVGPGVAAGVVCAVPLAAAIGCGFINRRTRPFLHDARAEALQPHQLAFEVFVRIPLETALAEELLFRGVYLALARRRGSDVYAILASSLAFGLWHVPPARAALHRTASGRLARDRRSHRVSAVSAMVASTAIAGAGLAALRLRSRSVIAPVIVHGVLNATALMGAWVAARSSQQVPGRLPWERHRDRLATFAPPG
jgi:hypothetical protein